MFHNSAPVVCLASGRDLNTDASKFGGIGATYIAPPPVHGKNKKVALNQFFNYPHAIVHPARHIRVGQETRPIMHRYAEITAGL